MSSFKRSSLFAKGYLNSTAKKGFLVLLLFYSTAFHTKAQSFEELKDTLSANPSFAEKGIISIIENDNSPDTLQLQLWYVLAFSQESQQKYPLALESYKKALELAQNLGDTAKLFNTRIRMANCQFYQGNYTECFELYMANYSFASPLNDCVYEPTATINLAGIYYYMGKKDKCLEFQRKAHALAIVCKDTHTIQRSARNIAALYTEEAKTDSAQHWMKIGIDLIPKTSYSELSNAYAIYGMSFPYPAKKEERLRYYHIALDYAIQGKDSLSMAFAYLKFTSHFILEKQLDSAELYTEQALEIYRNNKLVDGIQHAMSYFPMIYELMGDKEKELKSLKNWFAIRDTILNEITSIKTAELETLYESEKKKRENLKLTAENAEKEVALSVEKSNKNRVVFISIIVLFLILIGTLVFFFRTRLKRKEELTKLEKDKTAAVIMAEEKERVRIARELHDGIGQQLSGLKLNFSQFSKELGEKLPEKSNSQIEKMESILDEACSDVRTISHQMMPRALQDTGLLAAIENMLRQSLSGTNIEYNLEHYKADGRFDSKVEVSFYRICQELVNNIMKHSGASQINIQLSQIKNNLIMVVEDNGHGFDSKKKKNGIGLLNMRTRIDTINGKIDIDSTEKTGTTATVRVALS